jgi:hypothetical protein
MDFDKIMIKGSRFNKKVMFLITFYLIKVCLQGFTPHPLSPFLFGGLKWGISPSNRREDLRLVGDGG